MTSINFIEEEECPKHSDSLEIPDFKAIYHGCMSREVSVKALKASGKNNSYLIRKRINPDENEKCIEYILSFLHNDEDYHFKIKKENKYFIFAHRYFPTFKCLISHYTLSNIINDAHLEFAVYSKSISSVRETLCSLPCYLSESISNDRLKEILHRNHAGSYLFRARSDDNNGFVLLFFDGIRIHKLKLDIRLMEKKSPDGNLSEPVVVFVLGQNYFESWQELVDNFTNNPMVALVDGQGIDKLVTAVNVNNGSGDIYRQIKFSRALPQRDAFSIHGEVLYSDGPKKKWKQSYASVDKDHGQLILKSLKSNNVIELNKCNFIPIHYSVFGKYCFLLEQKDQKIYYISMVEHTSLGQMSICSDHKDMSEEAYAYRPYNLMEHDKEVYNCTETGTNDNSDILTCRAYDRWTTAVKRHCLNTKDDIANEENKERHLKLHRYNRRLKVSIGHYGGPDITLTDLDLLPNSSISIGPSQQSFPPAGQFEVMYREHLIAVVPREKKSVGPQILLFQDLPSDIQSVSVYIRYKGSRRKEYFKELINFTMSHQELVPRTIDNYSSQNQDLDQSGQLSNITHNLSFSNIQNDPPSCGPVSVDCWASIDYKESIILPFNNYTTLSKYMMENLEKLFSNRSFYQSFKYALEFGEYKKLLNCLLSMAIWEKKQIELLFFFLKSDLKGQNPNEYFRQNSPGMRLFMEYTDQFAIQWLVCSLASFFEKIRFNTNILTELENPNDESASPEPAEPSKPSFSDDDILKCLKAALEGINGNLEHCPLPLRQLFYLLQNEIKSNNDSVQERLTDNLNDSHNSVKYRLVTNLVLFRFFCAILNSRGEALDNFLDKISYYIKKKVEHRPTAISKTLLSQSNLNIFMTNISKLIMQTYGSSKTQKEKSAINDFIDDYREKTFSKFHTVLTQPLTPKEEEMKSSQLDKESEVICRLSSLSRRFNDVLEFLTELNKDPSYFLKAKPDADVQNQLDIRISDIIPNELREIIEIINNKKSCHNVLIDRL